MMQRRKTKAIATLAMGVWFSMVVQTHATFSNPLITIDIESPVHFLAPDGSPLVAETNTFMVEAAEDWIRLVPDERHNAVLIEAQKGTHQLELSNALALSVPGTDENHKDLHHVILLLPDGQSLESIGSYSGIRPRGMFDNVVKDIKKQTNRALKQARSTAKKTINKANKAGKHIQKHTKRATKHVQKGVRHAKKAALRAKHQVERTARNVAAKVKKSLPKVRKLTAREKQIARTVFRNTINYDMVRVTNTLGAGERPWTTNSPPLYTINVGPDYPSLTANDDRKRLLIHELAHVWQGQHLVPFMINSGVHQALSVINNGGDVTKAYHYKVGKPWNKYNVEQQASIVTHWYTAEDVCFKSGPCGGGMKTSDSRYRYIRDHIRKNKAH